MLMCDFYKLSHRVAYPKGTSLVYSTWTPRASRFKGIDHVVNFGLQAFIKKFLKQYFDNNFFNRELQVVCSNYVDFMEATLGIKNAPIQHIVDLHQLGFLPLSIKALPEGAIVPLRVPLFTIENTDPRFFWLTNFIETLMSCELWQATTSATIAREYRKLLNRYAELTCDNSDFVDFQGHDFSMRGMSSLDSAVSSGMGHLLYFKGTDTVPAIQGAEFFYHANPDETGTSIPATEHSIQCAYQDDELYFDKIISEIYPEGFVSIVADGYDFWGVIADILPTLKKKIMARLGRVVIRPDSGDPVLIICGDPQSDGILQRKGAIKALWDLFGGTINEKGFKCLDPHIGLIYGDSITLERAQLILSRLKEDGFASCNIVFGIGSYTYQYNTRDTFGFALKSTLCIINGEEKHIYKDPKTDDGTKKSQRGRVVVVNYDNTYVYLDGIGLNVISKEDCLVEVFRNGELLVNQTFLQIKERAKV